MNNHRKKPHLAKGLLLNLLFLGAWGVLVPLAAAGQPDGIRPRIVVTALVAFALGFACSGWAPWASRLSDWRHARRVARLRRRGFVVCSDCAEPLCEVCGAHRSEPHSDTCPLSSQHRSRIPTPREIPTAKSQGG